VANEASVVLSDRPGSCGGGRLFSFAFAGFIQKQRRILVNHQRRRTVQLFVSDTDDRNRFAYAKLCCPSHAH
jgi:hypothetical protein